MIFMPMLKIPALGIAQNLRDNLLRTKPLESYSADYVEFVVRITLSSILGNVTPVSATWNARRNCWEGDMNYLGKNNHWVITE